MPIYEYRCNACGHTFTLLRMSSSAAAVTCAQCESEDVAKLLSSFSCSAGSSSGGFSGGSMPSGGT